MNKFLWTIRLLAVAGIGLGVAAYHLETAPDESKALAELTAKAVAESEKPKEVEGKAIMVYLDADKRQFANVIYEDAAYHCDYFSAKCVRVTQKDIERMPNIAKVWGGEAKPVKLLARN